MAVKIRYMGMMREMARIGFGIHQTEELQLFYLRLYVCRPLPLHPPFILASGVNLELTDNNATVSSEIKIDPRH